METAVPVCATMTLVQHYKWKQRESWTRHARRKSSGDGGKGRAPFHVFVVLTSLMRHLFKNFTQFLTGMALLLLSSQTFSYVTDSSPWSIKDYYPCMCLFFTPTLLFLRQGLSNTSAWLCLPSVEIKGTTILSFFFTLLTAAFQE